MNGERQKKIHDLRIKAEDECAKYVDGLSKYKAALMYKLLYLQGHRIGTVDITIDEGLRKEAE